MNRTRAIRISYTSAVDGKPITDVTYASRKDAMRYAKTLIKRECGPVVILYKIQHGHYNGALYSYKQDAYAKLDSAGRLVQEESVRETAE